MKDRSDVHPCPFLFMLKGTQFGAGSRVTSSVSTLGAHSSQSGLSACVVRCDLIGFPVNLSGMSGGGGACGHVRSARPGEGLAPAGTLVHPAVRVTACPGASLPDDPVPQGADRECRCRV